jgi:hypothetical protein
MSFLVFIDTNIYLDFYSANNDASLSLLKHVDGNHDRIITTDQIEMEYKKNRQNTILRSLNAIKPQTPPQLNIPSFLKESEYLDTSKKLTKEWKKVANKLAARTEKLLESPESYDPVYQILARLFKAKGACHLTLDKEEIRSEIHNKAYERYLSGYPPRKATDTSIGDAINWEWIIYCANKCKDSIIVISRDADYGQHHKDKSFINDWLLHEFKARVSRGRSIKLTRRLSEGFKLAGIAVPKEQEQAENSLLTRYGDTSVGTAFPTPVWTIGPTGPMQSVGTAFATPAWTTGPTGPTQGVFTYAVPVDSFQSYQNIFTAGAFTIPPQTVDVPPDLSQDSNVKFAHFDRQSAGANVDTAIDKPKKDHNEPQNDNSDPPAKQ